MKSAAQNSSEQGFALFVALIALTVVGAVVTTLTHGSRDSVRATALERARTVTFHAAEGGVELARARLARAAEYRGETMRIGASDVTVTVTARSAGGWRVRSIARSQPFGAGGLPVTRVVEADLLTAAKLPRVVAWSSR